MDPRTPVVVGVGQSINRRERLTDPMQLMDEAARAADADAGGGALARVGAAWVVNILGWRYPDPAATLSERLGIDPADRAETTVGGSTPQWLACEAAERIASGRLDGALIVGAEAMDSARRARKDGVELDRGDRDAAPSGAVIGDDRSPLSAPELNARLAAPNAIYPMFEQALAARAGRTPDEQRRACAELMAPFTTVAASREFAWFKRERTVDELADVGPDNRMIAEPYPKNLNAIMQVDQGAAVIMLSAEAARAAGVPEDRWVFPWAGAKCDDVYMTAQRPHFDRSPAIDACARATFAASGVGVDEVAHIDLYSCFPCMVEIGADALGLAYDDPRGLTVTGGLPYFGGPGNNYVTHSIATMVDLLRADDGLGLLTGNSWYATRHSFGLYGSTPSPGGWRYADTAADQARIDAEALPLAEDGQGKATVDAFTVLWDRDGPTHAPVYATLDDGRRVVASPAHPEIAADLAGTSLVGRAVSVTAGDGPTVYEPV